MNNSEPNQSYKSSLPGSPAAWKTIEGLDFPKHGRAMVKVDVAGNVNTQCMDAQGFVPFLLSLVSHVRAEMDPCRPCCGFERDSSQPCATPERRWQLLSPPLAQRVA